MSANKVTLATLIHGLNYSHGAELFEQGVPKPVDAVMKAKLYKVIDSKPFADGTKGLRRKFHLQDHDPAEAQAILEKYGNVKPKDEELDIMDALSDDPESAGMVIMDAIQPSEIEAFYESQHREEVEVPQPKAKPGRSKPQA